MSLDRSSLIANEASFDVVDDRDAHSILCSSSVSLRSYKPREGRFDYNPKVAEQLGENCIGTHNGGGGGRDAAVTFATAALPLLFSHLSDRALDDGYEVSSEKGSQCCRSTALLAQSCTTRSNQVVSTGAGSGKDDEELSRGTHAARLDLERKVCSRNQETPLATDEGWRLHSDTNDTFTTKIPRTDPPSSSSIGDASPQEANGESAPFNTAPQQRQDVYRTPLGEGILAPAVSSPPFHTHRTQGDAAAITEEAKSADTSGYRSLPCGSRDSFYGSLRPQALPAGSASSRLRRTGLLPTYKMLVVGDAAVGKTNLLHRYCHGIFDPNAITTIGFEFQSRQVNIPTGLVGEETPVVLQLWDTAGQERCHIMNVSSAFYRNAVGALLVYDVTRRSTLLSIPGWAAQVRATASEECVCVVVGNKTDLLAEIPMSAIQEGEHVAHALGMRHMFASAYDGEGVLHAFTQVALSVNALQSVRHLGDPDAWHRTSRDIPCPTRDIGGVPSSYPSDGHTVGSPVVGSLLNACYAVEDRTIWTDPQTVPLAILSMDSPANTPGRMPPTMHMSGREGNCTRQRKALDLRGFGSEDNNRAFGDGGTCAC